MPRISELPGVSSGPLLGDELVPIVQGGVTGQTTAQDIANLTLATGGGGLKGLVFTSDTGSTADVDPGPGLMRWNNATQAAATVLFFDNTTANGVEFLAKKILIN